MALSMGTSLSQYSIANMEICQQETRHSHNALMALTQIKHYNDVKDIQR